jgi:hypothetical protein
VAPARAEGALRGDDDERRGDRPWDDGVDRHEATVGYRVTEDVRARGLQHARASHRPAPDRPDRGQLGIRF